MWWLGLRELRGLGVVPESPRAQREVEGVTGNGRCWSGKNVKKAGDRVLARIYCNDQFLSWYDLPSPSLPTSGHLRALPPLLCPFHLHSTPTLKHACATYATV